MARPKHPNMEAFAREMDALPMTARCLFCTWEWEGTVAEGRTEALTHRLIVHPDVKPPRRRPGRHLKSFRQPRLKPEDWADVNAERARRARLTGVTIEE